MVNTRSVRAGNSSLPLGQGQLPNNLPPQLPPQLPSQLPPHIPNMFPPVDHVEEGNENQPHTSAHNSTSTANQDVVTAQLTAMQQKFDVFSCESQGQSHIAPDQQPLPGDVTRRLDNLEKLVADHLPPRSISSYTEMASAFATKFSSRRLIRKTTSKLMRVKQRDGESLKNYMSRFNDAVLEVSSFNQTVGIAAVISGLNHDWFRDSLIKHPTTTFSEEKDEDDTEPRSDADLYTEIRKAELYTPTIICRHPGPMRTAVASRDHTRYCDFHQDHSHTTEQCNSLRSELESLAQKGMLNEYIQRAEQPRFVREQRPQSQGIRNPPNRQGVGYQQAPPPLPPPARIIHMIMGGLEAGGLSSKQRKLYVREVKHQNRAQKRKFDDADWKNEPVTFTSADFETVVMPHNDPLVTSVMINNCEVEGVLTLHVAFGSGRTYVTPSVRFLVVNMASSFNVVIGRPTLTEIRVVVSQSHLCMKFPTPMGIATLRGNQEVQVMGVEIVDNRPEDEPRATPVEDVEEVLVDDRDPSRKTQIGTRLNPEEIAELIAFLRANNDVFAWTSADMPGIPPSVSQHKLSTNSLKKLVAQKRLLVKKANGKWRMCIDYTNLNQAYPKDCYPMPSIDRLVEAASGNERLRLLDAYFGYHQVPMALEDEEKTSFYAGDEIYCYVMMPFDLKNAGATYQKMVTIIFRAQIGRNLEVYVDDIVVKSLKVEDHLADLNETFNNLRKNRMRLNPAKYIFGVESRKFLGQALADFIVECTPCPSTLNPEPNGWTLYVDGASSSKGSGAGALLIGLDGYRSEHALKFNFDATNNMAEYEALLLGLQLALELKISAIQVYSDSQLVVDSFSKFASDSSLSSRSVFVEVLDEPSFIKPRMMEISIDPDTLSWTDPIISFLRDGIVPEDRQGAMELRKKASRYTLVEGVLYKRSFSLPLLRCLNPYEAEYALREVHEGVCMSHVGARTLAHKVLRQGYYWPNMYKDATHFVQKCPKCQFFAHLTHQPVEELTNLVAPWPFAKWGLDLLGPFVKGVGGVTHLIIGVDYFTKWVEAQPLSSLTSKKVEDFVFSSIICRYGIPNQIFTSVYHPESNGMVESVNKCIVEGVPSFRVTHFDEGRNGQLLQENLDLLAEVREEARLRTLVKAGLTWFETRFDKLAPNWEGPYTVAEVPHPGAYVLQDVEGKRVPRVWKVNNLKKFYP
ncbi:hypothetical protein SLEP1_g44802 [Rubroshorea leprosula]|uniref:Uncharacterized protein n=1 Tax=Rubroshorea leprosula TaxID=152421 RepID=A0AAV5LJH1_9ROSI|nr:hypothetical protein SLEP1_g44802 [Rubroshorea leprosula]